MKKLKPEDLFQHLNGFLKDKGVELAGSKRISQSLRRSCEKITQSINTANQAIRFAKKQVEAKLDQMRDAIHLKTTPPNTNNTPKKQNMKAKKKAAKKPAKKVVKKAAPKKVAKKAAAKKVVKKAAPKKAAPKKAAKKAAPKKAAKKAAPKKAAKKAAKKR